MRIVGLVVALGLVALGCSSERAATVETTTGTTAQPTSAAPEATHPTDRAVETANRAARRTTTTLPAGSMGARVPHTDVRFAVPELYTELNPTELQAGFYDSASFTDLAARVDIDPETFETALRENLDLFFFAPADKAGLVGKVSVDVRSQKVLPNPAEQRRELSTLGDIESVETADVGGVRTLQSRYVTASNDGEPVFAFDLMVVADGGLVDITATTTTETETNALAKLITTTLRIGN